MTQLDQITMGARVGWKAGGRALTGEVVRWLTCRFALGRELVMASAAAPRLLVRRDDNGALVTISPRQVRRAQERA